MPERSFGEMPEGIPGRIFFAITRGTPEGTAERMTEKSFEEMTEGALGEVSHGTPRVFPEGTSGDTSGVIEVTPSCSLSDQLLRKKKNSLPV